jgi:hypothetical protein
MAFEDWIVFLSVFFGCLGWAAALFFFERARIRDSIIRKLAGKMPLDKLRQWSGDV